MRLGVLSLAALVASSPLAACSGGETVLGTIDAEGSPDPGGPDEAAANEADALDHREAEADAPDDLPDEAGAEDVAADFEFDFYVFGLDYAAADFVGPPVAGVLVAVDLPAHREDLVTGLDGGVHVSLPSDAPHVTLTAAKVGWLPVTTIYRATRAELEQRLAEDGRLFAIVSPKVAPPTTPATLEVSSPSSARFVASVDFLDSEGIVSGLWRRTVRSNPAEAWNLVAQAVDADDCPVELYEETFPDLLSDRTVEFPFDGSGAAVPERVDLAIRIPADPVRPSERAEVSRVVRRPFYVLHDAAHHFVIRGGACAEELSPDGTTMQASVRWFPPASGTLRSLLFVDVEGAAWWDGPLSYQMLAGPPTAGTYDVLDIPNARTTPYVLLPTLASTFLPPSVAGGNTGDLIVSNDVDHREQLWVARSFRLQELTLPELPAGYDRAIDWPDHNQAGYRVRTCVEPVPVNQILYLGAKCALSDVRSGTFE